MNIRVTAPNIQIYRHKPTLLSKGTYNRFVCQKSHASGASSGQVSCSGIALTDSLHHFRCSSSAVVLENIVITSCQLLPDKTCSRCFLTSFSQMVRTPERRNPGHRKSVKPVLLLVKLIFLTFIMIGAFEIPLCGIKLAAS